MTIKHLLIAAVTAILIGSNTGHASNVDVQTLLQEYVDDNGAVGASVALIDNEKVQFFSYGKKSVDGDDPISEDTIFEIGSITKVFTTSALMDMVSKGEVQLDDPIEMYLPGIKVPELEGNKITLRHLASHTSGLPRMPDNFDPENQANPYIDYAVEDLYEFLNHCILQKVPGEHFEYSNIGMGLLGHILCLKAGKSYEQLISDSIFKKLEMKNSGISLTSKMEMQFAKGHHLSQLVDYWTFQQSIAGAGALRSNVKDMTQFLAANMGLLNSPVTNLLKECHQLQYAPHLTLGVGLGWILSDPSNEKKVIWHDGGTGGFRAFVGFNPHMQKGIVILTNSTEDWPSEFGKSMLNSEFKSASAHPIERNGGMGSCSQEDLK